MSGLNSPPSAADVLEAINASFKTDFHLVGRYAVGETGAYLLGNTAGERFVLKWSRPEQMPLVTAAAEATSRLRALGYPAPFYAVCGKFDDLCFGIQRVLPGRPGPIRATETLDQLVALNDLHRGRGAWLREVFPDRPRWANEMVHAVLVGYPEHDYCWLEPVRSFSPASAELLERTQTFVAAHAEDIAYVTEDDIVHYDFSPANTLQDEQRVTGIVDWQGVRAGDRVFDLVTLLYYVYADPDVRQRALAAALDRSRPSVIGIYLAHMLVRQVDFSVRHHTVEAAKRWLQHSQHVLDGITTLSIA
jgi:hypothetical protein